MNKIKIGLFGFGKTGKLVAQEFFNNDSFELAWVAKRTISEDFTFASEALGLKGERGQIIASSEIDQEFFRNNQVDIIVDFSDSSGVNHYASAADLGTKIISAISQYESGDMEYLKNLGLKTAVLYSPNITIGINLILMAAQIFQNILPHADIEIIEEHFRNKNEVSGTAKKIADTLGLDEETQINSIRVGGIVGKHEVIFGLPNQTIRLTHESISKAAFGQGAIFAAKWLINAGPGLYCMEDVIKNRVQDQLLEKQLEEKASGNYLQQFKNKILGLFK